MKIYSLKSGSMNELDRLELARLLIKSGYTARIGKEKTANKSNSASIHFVEFGEGGINEQ